MSAAALECLARQLEDEGIAARIQTAQGPCSALPQSWLDDVALLLGADGPQEVEGVVGRTAALAHQYLAITGVHMNYA